MLELRHLRSLIALSQTGNLSTAAQRVHLTQSALSHQMRALEEYFSASLFERKTRPLRFSAAGQRLLQLAGEVLPAIEGAHRDVTKLAGGSAGNLRIAVECHTCFDWLMPAMDAFRENWPEVELDLVSGFHPDPLALIEQSRADLVVMSEKKKSKGVTWHPLFRFEIAALLANDHSLVAKPFLKPRDFAAQTLITYPVPDEMLDIMRDFLQPGGIKPARRTAELTVAILQLVASRRGMAALPVWSVQSYLERGYVARKRLGKEGLWSTLYAATATSLAELPFMQDFLQTLKSTGYAKLQDVIPAEASKT